MKPYSIIDSHKIVALESKAKEYILTVRDLPEDEKPREKLLAHGAYSLSVAELLSVILGTGTKKEGVLEMSRRILKEYGEQAFAGHLDPKKLSEDLSIPLYKAMQIAACSELGRRYFDKNGRPTLRSAKDVYEYLKDMRSLPKEHLRGLYLNSHYKLIHDEVISIGTIDANIIHPREVFRPALEYGAVAVILAHNHPSGDPLPSTADKEVTKQLIEAGKIMGVRLLDHIVVSEGGFATVEGNY